MNAGNIRILLIEEGGKYAALIRDLLEGEGGGEGEGKFLVEWSRQFADGLKQLEEGRVDVALLDLAMEQDGGLDMVHQAIERAPATPIIVLSSVDDEDLAVRAVHEGAQDYLVKDTVGRPLLTRAIRYAIERKRTEVALGRAEEKYRSIFENTVEGIFQTTPDGRYISANSALARIYGYAAADELMESLTDIGSRLYVEPARREQFVQLIQKNEVVQDFVSQVYRRDGTVIWISENVRAVRNPQGEIMFYEGTVEDITERVRAEQRLEDSEALYHSLVENLPQNIFRKALSERFTFANQRFCLTLGRPLEQILGKTDFDFFPPELAEKYQQDDRHILETGEIFETIEEHQPPNGGKIYVNVVKTPIHDAEGRIVGLQGIFWDITEKKRAEELARKANQELARSREELRMRNLQMEEDLRMAREIQMAIIPQQYPTFPAQAAPESSVLRFSHRYFPTGMVGGDFFNVMALSDTMAGLFVCDVMGHGVRSALVTAIMRALVEELTPTATDPGQLLTQINRDLRAILKQTGTPMFTTAFYAVVDLERDLLTYANAGHPKPFLLHRQRKDLGVLANADGKSKPALGLIESSCYSSSQVALEPGDLLFAFTDGIYDVEGGFEDILDQQWLMDLLVRRMTPGANEMLDAILEEIAALTKNAPFADDVCLLAMDYKLPAQSA